MSDLPPCLRADQPERTGPLFAFCDGSPFAMANRIATLHHLHRGREVLSLLCDVLRAMPGDDTVLDEAIGVPADELDKAGGYLATYRAMRECSGSA